MPLPTSDLNVELSALQESYIQLMALQHEQQQQQRRHLLHQTSQASILSAKAESGDLQEHEPHQPQLKPMYGSAAGIPQSTSLTFNTVQLPLGTPLRANQQIVQFSFDGDKKSGLNASADLASLDSSDTYASCQTHPFLSQGDLTSNDDLLLDCSAGDQDLMYYNIEGAATGSRGTGSILDFMDYATADNTNNLYVNPLQKGDSGAKLQKKLSASSMGIRNGGNGAGGGGLGSGGSGSGCGNVMPQSQVKKSASGGDGIGGFALAFTANPFNSNSSSNQINSNNNTANPNSSNSNALSYSSLREFKDSSSSKSNPRKCRTAVETSHHHVNLMLDGDAAVDPSFGFVATGDTGTASAAIGGSGATVLSSATVPKHRKTRFQQQQHRPTPQSTTPPLPPPPCGVLQQPHAGSCANNADNVLCSSALSTSSGGSGSTITGSQVLAAEPTERSLTPTSSMKKKRALFMPTKSLASATKLINQHLFGSGTGGNGSGGASASSSDRVSVAGIKQIKRTNEKSLSKKSMSLSNDSLDEDRCEMAAHRRKDGHQRGGSSPIGDAHRRSKSILKNKGEHRIPNKFVDSENERLLSETANELGESSPNRSVVVLSAAKPPLAAVKILGGASGGSLSGQQKHRVLAQQRSMPSDARSPSNKYQVPRQSETEMVSLGHQKVGDIKRLRPTVQRSVGGLDGCSTATFTETMLQGKL